eukprot:1605325-Rhodomonas_salina.2
MVRRTTSTSATRAGIASVGTRTACSRPRRHQHQHQHQHQQWHGPFVCRHEDDEDLLRMMSGGNVSAHTDLHSQDAVWERESERENPTGTQYQQPLISDSEPKSFGTVPVCLGFEGGGVDESVLGHFDWAFAHDIGVAAHALVPVQACDRDGALVPPYAQIRTGGPRTHTAKP